MKNKWESSGSLNCSNELDIKTGTAQGVGLEGLTLSPFPPTQFLAPLKKEIDGKVRNFISH